MVEQPSLNSIMATCHILKRTQVNPLGKWVWATCPGSLRGRYAMARSQRDSNPRPHGRWSSTLTTRPPCHPIVLYMITAIFEKWMQRWGIKHIPVSVKLCCHHVSVFLSLTSMYCTHIYNKVAKHRIMQTMLNDSTQINCCFWYLYLFYYQFQYFSFYICIKFWRV